ncbi:hypothetical protein CEP54_010952 [Fusarium duplospermum]|uniref:Uncharacterized protein n=1 Tax=Fusarium duplospermum TaxID=1325734 RepID=A0A428PHF3_9HYPO|nr:hypothetical protein CEP54_010952 [Fusarium duplospermum]
MPKDDKHKKMTEDMPLGARIGMNIMLAAAPPTLRRHAIRRLERGQRPIRKTRAERQREWEMEQARKDRNGESRSDWTPQSRSPCPWDEDDEEGSGSDDEMRGGGTNEEQVESRDISRNGDESGVEMVMAAALPHFYSSGPSEFTREPSQSFTNDQPDRGQHFFNGAEPTCRNLPAATSPACFPSVASDTESITTGYQRIYKWSSQINENPPAIDDNRTSVSTAWPGPQTDAGDEVAPSESISVVGHTPDPEGMYRRGRIAPSSRRSESTKWSQV